MKLILHSTEFGKLFPENPINEFAVHFPARLPRDDDGSPGGVGVDGRRVVADDGAARGRPRLLRDVLRVRDRALPLLLLNSQEMIDEGGELR